MSNSKANKDTFWFKHDYSPTGDLKMLSMLDEFGATGYGLYWHIAELLHIEAEHKLPLENYVFAGIAKQMQANAKQTEASKFKIELTEIDVKYFVDRCINSHKLISSDGNYFWSERVNRNIDEKKRISKVRSESGSKGGESKANTAKS